MTVPKVNYAAVRGKGDPNEEDGAYQRAVGIVYAVDTVSEKKKMDCSPAEFLTVEEGLCVQMMHFGAFDREPETVAVMDRFVQQNGYENDLNSSRF